ncbi:potassium channel family protein [Halohasta salina]|uniref:potassium channel family protein n=1 Tax=Halohasta salina TaxID=2961621 RepID=UPI0020A3C45A|nr:NAD-binding protein [Halohasta salina]
MGQVRRRAIGYVIGIAVIILVSAVAYDVGSRTYEPDYSFSFLQSVQFVVETFTATGYGSHAPWESPQMNVLVMLLDITGVALFFVALPAVFLPVFRQALSTSAPTSADPELADHVIICTFSSRAETLIDELDADSVEYVLIEGDRDRADELFDRGLPVVYADPESVAGLEAANVGSARAIVADVSDRVDASIVLAAQEANDEVRVVSVVEDPDRERYHRLAGADAVVSPRTILGENLAGKLTAAARADLEAAIEIGDSFAVAEIPIDRDGPLAGSTLAESAIHDRYGATVVGAWRNGDFQMPPDPEMVLDTGVTLIVTGEEPQLDRLESEATAAVRSFGRGETVVVGHGEVGGIVADRLAAADLPHTVVDTDDREGVDVVGDGTDPAVLERAGVTDARSVVLALPDDTATEFATLIVRDLNPDAEIIARAESAGAINKTYRAGAEYVLSLSTVSGRAIAEEILDDEEILSMDTRIECIRTPAPGLIGETLAGADIRGRTGSTVVAVERDGELHTDLSPTFRIEHGDELVVVGTDASASRFVELFG